MEIQGKWRKDPEGFMEFDNGQLQRYYEAITDQYHKVYDRYLDELDDEELAAHRAGEEGYRMVTDYKTINEKKEFATTYTTPAYVMDVWYQTDPISGKRIYGEGFLRISSK